MLQVGAVLFSRGDSFLTGLPLTIGYTSRLFQLSVNEINASRLDYNSSAKIRTTEPIALLMAE